MRKFVYVSPLVSDEQPAASASSSSMYPAQPQSPMNQKAYQAPDAQNFRPRRPHKKSRNGCLKCKQERKKCDELKPRCTKCSERSLVCQYPNKWFASDHARPLDPGEARTQRKRQRRPGPPPSQPAREEFWHHIQSFSPAMLLAPDETLVHASPSPGSSSASPPFSISIPGLDDELSVGIQRQPGYDPPLGNRQLELLGHYFTHTAQAVAYDRDDLYALKVGFPDLAYRNRALMGSLLALSAVCKCHDIAAQHGPRGANPAQTQMQTQTQKQKQKQRSWDEIVRLLAFADQQHQDSLRRTRSEIPSASHYQFVLANAPLMVLYGFASHSARIRFAETLTDRETPPASLVPAQSQWLSLVRAAHLAYTGMINDPALHRTSPPAEEKEEDEENEEGGGGVGKGEECPGLDGPGFQSCHPDSPSNVGDVASHEDGPTPHTKRLLLPILASTSGDALRSLRSRADAALRAAGADATPSRDRDGDDLDRQRRHRSLSTSPSPFPGAGGSAAANLQACLEALDVLESIMARVFRSDGREPATSSPAASPAQPRFAGIPPWLRDYLARVTMASPSKPLRRTIPAFINKVSPGYLSLIQATLDAIPRDQSDYGHADADAEADDPDAPPPFDAAYMLALDIFAHWLVLVMLLDGVWWIGGIGAWELGRVVSFMKGARARAQARLGDSAGASLDDDGWWPESMYRIGKELRNQGLDRPRGEGRQTPGRDRDGGYRGGSEVLVGDDHGAYFMDSYYGERMVGMET